MTTKINLNAAVAAIMAGVLLVPALASADDHFRDRASTTRPSVDRGVNICENIDDLRDKVLEKLSDRAEHVRDRGDSRNNNVDTDRDERRSDWETKKAEKEAEREGRYDSLREKADTDEKSEAVETFISTVQELLDDRQDAFDAAIAAFEDSVVDLKEEMQSTVSTLETDVEEELNAIFDEAEDACDEDASADEVRGIISEGMQALRTSHESNRANYSFREEFEALREARKEAFEAAQATFKEGLEAAKEELRAAFENDDDDNDDDEDDGDSDDE